MPRCSLPSVRSFVMVQFDPVATNAHLENPELTAACQKLETKKYVAYVDLAVGLPTLVAPYRSYVFYLVHQGLRQNREKGITEEMSVPILPNTSHPLSRTPIHPDKPLPWDNCYVSPGFTTGARCPTILLDQVPQTRIEISTKEAWQLQRYMDEDKLEMELLTKPPGATGVEQDVNTVPQDESKEAQVQVDVHEQEGQAAESSKAKSMEGSHPNQPGEQAPAKNEIPVQAAEERVDDDASSTGRESNYVEGPGEIALGQIVLKASFDLSEVDQINDPAELFEEIRSCLQLYKDLELGRKERNIERARQVDEAYFANLSQTGKTSQTQTEPPAKTSRIQLYRSKIWSKVKGSMQTIKRRMFCM
ncbi:hypothetical protein Moror_3898 [Moniliophthora roreri MCA 2997]|uniref:Uncharacterized protein n=1 Tax=Moniliophthora roreri (strain MCA 2997) TaxID=1381753 RepID=V2XR41_MONRO|nr:hypothetical protein Moror_3898 [Moniliophthora roreri MCA 2997]